MTTHDELTARERQVLEAVIQTYVQTAEPAGSRVLARRHGLGVSPATIRNTMSDLEEKGFLSHPHTSAGRVPTDKAYRAYVDSLLNSPGRRHRRRRARAAARGPLRQPLDHRDDPSPRGSEPWRAHAGARRRARSPARCEPSFAGSSSFASAAIGCCSCSRSTPESFARYSSRCAERLPTSPYWKSRGCSTSDSADARFANFARPSLSGSATRRRGRRRRSC